MLEHPLLRNARAGVYTGKVRNERCIGRKPVGQTRSELHLEPDALTPNRRMFADFVMQNARSSPTLPKGVPEQSKGNQTFLPMFYQLPSWAFPFFAGPI